jgi:hypothetical protein
MGATCCAHAYETAVIKSLTKRRAHALLGSVHAVQRDFQFLLFLIANAVAAAGIIKYNRDIIGAAS